MGKITVAAGGVKALTKVSTTAVAKNTNRDRTTMLRPPRLKPLTVGTRDYAKQELEAEKPPAWTTGFGRTGLSGES